MSKRVDKYQIKKGINERDLYASFYGVNVENQESVYIRSFPLKNPEASERVTREMQLLDVFKPYRINQVLSYLKTSNNLYHVYQL